MIFRSGKSLGGLLTASTLVAAPWSSPAAAQMTKSQCIDANTHGQDLRREGKLSGARHQFRSCADVACPAIVRDDCTRRLDEVNNAQPTIVFGAKDEAESDVSAVRVTMDGVMFAEKLDGTALAVDPGEHLFDFSTRGQSRVTRVFVIREGEKDRRERIVISTGVAPPPVAALSSTIRVAPAATDTGAGASDSAAGTSSGLPTALGWTGLAVGGAGIAVGATFGFLAKSAIDDQATDCSSAASCRDQARALSDHSRATTDGAISTAAFTAGGVLVVAGTILLLTAHPSPRTPARALAIVPSLGLGSTGILLKGSL